jgi:hypothetical protein
MVIWLEPETPELLVFQMVINCPGAASLRKAANKKKSTARDRENGFFIPVRPF